MPQRSSGNPMEHAQLPRKLSAILYADVAGYSRLTGEDEEGTHLRVDACLEAITTLTEQYGGKVLNYAGDAVLADFATVSDALICAAVIQQDLGKRDPELAEERQIRFRIGVNLGEVIVDRGEIFGDGVNIAARLEGLADPGGICISGTVYDAIGNKLPFDYQFMGEQQVKNIAKPVRAYRVQPRAGAVLPRPRDGAKSPAPKHKWLAFAGAAIAILFIVAGLATWLAPTLSPTGASRIATVPASEKPSVAVLPFTNLNKDPQQDYFSDGITNDVITDLSKFGSLFVIASNSVFAYKGKAVKVQNLSAELGVRYVVEGSVQRTQDKVRVNAQLIDADTGRHMWAERYERALSDLFAVQDEIVQSIVGHLAVKVAAVERERAMRKDTENLEAYDYVLRGREYFSRVTRPSNMAARKMFQRAIELDPQYAAAYAGLGWTYRQSVGHGWTEFMNEALQQAHDLAQAALRAREIADAHGLLGSVYLVRGEYDLAMSAAQRAITLNPNDAESLRVLASVLLYTGSTDEAVKSYETALRFDPRANADRFFTMGLAYYLQKEYAKAVATLERGSAENPNHPFIHAALAATYARMGRAADANRAVSRVRRLSPFFDVESFGSRFRNQRERDQLAAGLAQAGLR